MNEENKVNYYAVIPATIMDIFMQRIGILQNYIM